jgi:hypothetical protein
MSNDRELEPWMRETNTLKFRRVWRSTRSNAPVLVFAPGFLTEHSPDDPTGAEQWRLQLHEISYRTGFSTYLLHWPSSTIATMLANRPVGLGNNAGSHRDLVGTTARILFPLDAESIFPIRSTHAQAQGTWRKAVADADDAAKLFAGMSANSKVPLVLAGHSLGGRLVIQAGVHARTRQFSSIFALAPACSQDVGQLNSAAKSVRGKLWVFHSTKDAALGVWYRLLELTLEASLGYAGPPAGAHPRVAAVNCSPKGTRHADYCVHMAEMLIPRLPRPRSRRR